MNEETWPIALNRFAERGSYRLTPHKPNLRTNFDAGNARVRRRTATRVSTFQFDINMENDEFEVFKSFYHFNLTDGTKWFKMEIWQGSKYKENTVRFVSEYTASDAGYNNTRVNFNLETRNLDFLDSNVLFIRANYRPEEWNTFANVFEKLVNVDFNNANS